MPQFAPTFNAFTLFFFATTAILPRLALANNRSYIESCGAAYYNTSIYTCYNGDFLCPIISGEPTLPCGSACYSPCMYACTSNTLSLLPPETGVFTLTASNAYAPFDGLEIQASGEHFYIGLDAPSTYCPQPPLNSTQCAELGGTNTSLYNGGMAAISPGGQDTYWDPSGAMSFTVPHEEGVFPDGAYTYSRVYEGGCYFGPNSEMLTACPVDPDQVLDRMSGEGKRGVLKKKLTQELAWGKGRTVYKRQYGSLWQVFARLPGVQFSGDCVDFYAKVHQEAEGTIGAFEYI